MPWFLERGELLIGQSKNCEPVPAASHRRKYQRSVLSTIASKVSAQALTIVCALLTNKSIFMGIEMKDIR